MPPEVPAPPQEQKELQKTTTGLSEFDYVFNPAQAQKKNTNFIKLILRAYFA